MSSLILCCQAPLRHYPTFTAPFTKSLKAQSIQFVINLVHVMATMKPPIDICKSHLYLPALTFIEYMVDIYQACNIKIH